MPRAREACVTKISPTWAETALIDLQQRKLSAAHITEMTKRRGKQPRRSFFHTISLLNRNDALHVQSKVRNAVIRVLAGLDLGERNRDRVAGIHLHVAGKLAHLIRAHVRVELGFLISRNRGRVERNVVRTHADDDELDAVALLDREVGGLESIALRVSDHIYRLDCAGNRSQCDRATGRGGSRRAAGGSRRARRARIHRDVCCISRLFFSACTGTQRNYSNCNRKSIELHLLRPPRAVRWCAYKNSFIHFRDCEFIHKLARMQSIRHLRLS